MSAKELLTTISRIKGKSQREISKLIGIGPQHLNQKVNTGMLKFTELCRICDAAGLQLAMFDVAKHRRLDFDTAEFSTSDNNARFDDAEELLAFIGIELALLDADTGRVLKQSTGGYGRRVRAWVDGEAFDTMKANAISTGLNTEYYKYGGTEKYNVDDARELYRTDSGKWFFAIYGETRNSDSIASCSEEEAQAFIEAHGRIE